GVLPLLRRRRHNVARCPRELDSLPDKKLFLPVRFAYGLRNAEMLHLGVGKHLVDCVNGSARDARLVEDFDPFGARSGLGASADFLVERVPIPGPERRSLVIRTID